MSDLPATIPHRVLVIEDDDVDAAAVVRAFAKDRTQIAGRSLEATRVRKLADGLVEVESGVFDAVLLDLGLPDAVGLEAIQRLVQIHLTIPIIVLTGNEDARIGIEAMQAGASEHLVKSEIDANSLPRAVRYAIERNSREHSEQALQRTRASQEVLRTIRSMLTPGVDNEVTTENVSLDIAVTSYRPGLLGGDFCEVLDTVFGTTIGLVGKISTHSEHASPLALQLVAMLRTLVLTGATLAEIANGIDRYVAFYSQADQSARLFLFEIDDDSREIRYVSCGTRGWLLSEEMKEDSSPFDMVELTHRELPVGTGLSDDLLSPHTAPRPENGVLIVATNGCYNGRDQHGSRFGYERLIESVQANRHDPASHLADSAMDAIMSFTSEKLGYDATLLVIKLAPVVVA